MKMIAVIVGIVCVLALGWAWIRRGPKISQDADRFAAARMKTNQWANDPSSAPKGVLDIAARGALPAQSDRETADRRDREPAEASGGRPPGRSKREHRRDDEPETSAQDRSDQEAVNRHGQ